MGRQAPEEYVTRAEAAEALGVTERSLYNMVKRGILIPRHFKEDWRRTLFLHADVEQLVLTLRGDKSPDLQQVKALALQALSTARRSEQRLSDIFEHLGLDIPPMPRDESFVRALYADAKNGFYPSTVTNAEWLKFWSDMFFGMDEVYFELVTLLTGDDEPWKVFLDFSGEVLREMHKRDEDIPAGPKRLFRASREHLRHVGYMHCRRSVSAKIAHTVFDGRASAIDELEAIIG